MFAELITGFIVDLFFVFLPLTRAIKLIHAA